LAGVYGVPVVLHTDHCAKKLLPWLDGVIEAGEAYYRERREPLFSTHMLDLSELPLAENIEQSARYLARIAKLGMTLELEIGSRVARRTASTIAVSRTSGCTASLPTSSPCTTR